MLWSLFLPKNLQVEKNTFFIHFFGGKIFITLTLMFKKLWGSYLPMSSFPIRIRPCFCFSESIHPVNVFVFFQYKWLSKSPLYVCAHGIPNGVCRYARCCAHASTGISSTYFYLSRKYIFMQYHMYIHMYSLDKFFSKW
jgi:hypothetical protein